MNTPGSNTSAMLKPAMPSVPARASKARSSQPLQSTSSQVKGTTSNAQASQASRPTFTLSPRDCPWLKSGSRWLRTLPHAAWRCW